MTDRHGVPERVVDVEEARNLIAATFPALAGARVRFLAAGWDVTVFVVDERWAFRFPRRAVAVPGLERELAVLPALARLLEVPVPEPTYVASPGPAFAWPWYGAAYLEGEMPSPALDEVARRRLAPRLGRFLRELHGAELATPLPADPMGRVDMARRVPFARDELRVAVEMGLPDLRAAAEPILGAAEGLPPSPRRRLVHGDLNFRNIVVNRAGGLRGVIDWGDVNLGDPAMDLHVAWSLLPSAARPAFWDAYGPIEPDQALRARVVGIYLGAVIAQHGVVAAADAVRDEALASIRRTLED